jgi:hypothetical protein
VDNERLDELAALCEAATVGPWAWAQTAEKGYGASVGGDVYSQDDAECAHRLSGDLSDSESNFFVGVHVADCDGQPAAGNAAFIAAARTALPEMIAETRALRERCDALTRERDADKARMDWLSNARFIDADVRVMASDGLPAAMDWSWDACDGATLRDAIDVELLREAPINAV